MYRVTFTNPKTATTYVWPYNPPYTAMQPAGKSISIDRTSNTGNVGPVKQQGDDGPYIIKWDILVFTDAHEAALWLWYELSRKQSIYLTDFRNSQYEGQIIELSFQEIGAMKGPGDTDARGFYQKCTFGFEVWRFISGPQATAGVTP